MQPATLTAFEHQALPVGLSKGGQALTTTECGRLAHLANRRPGFCSLGYQSVKLAQYAGLVGLGGRVLEILPKVEAANGISEVGRGIFLRLLRKSRDLKLFTEGLVQQDLRRQPLLEVFIAAFLDAGMSLVRGGLFRTYQSTEDDLPLIRGRLLIGRQVATHALRVDRLACRFDELTVDNIWNQVLKAALYAAKPWISNLTLRRRWLELSTAFLDVSLRPFNATDLDVLIFDRQAVRYKPAIQWAKWILRVLSPNLRAGSSEAPELLFDMNKLFESAVVTILQGKAATVPGLRICAQETGAFLATVGESGIEKAFRLRPDIVIRDAGQVVAVGDTKWARVGVGAGGYLKPDEAHIYQMQAYASVYACDHFTLIYPWHAGLEGSKPTTFALPKIEQRSPVVTITCIDVGSDGFETTYGSSDSVIDRLLRHAFKDP